MTVVHFKQLPSAALTQQLVEIIFGCFKLFVDLKHCLVIFCTKTIAPSFKQMLTQRPRFESRLRHDNLYGQIYMVAFAPVIIVVLLNEHSSTKTWRQKPEECAQVLFPTLKHENTSKKNKKFFLDSRLIFSCQQLSTPLPTSNL